MGTKLEPGSFDCYNKAMPDEPMFILLARDPRAPELVRLWANNAESQDEGPDKVTEARKCAQDMIDWRLKNRTK